MLFEAGLPPSFWYWALGTQTKVGNCLPTTSLPGETPYEAWYKKKPDLGDVRVFGCTASVHVQRDKRKAFEPHMEKCVYLGHAPGYKGWRFYNPTTKKFIISERAEFDERYLPARFRAPAVPRSHPSLSSPSSGDESVPFPIPGKEGEPVLPPPAAPEPPPSRPDSPELPETRPSTPEQSQSPFVTPKSSPSPPSTPKREPSTPASSVAPQTPPLLRRCPLRDLPKRPLSQLQHHLAPRRAKSLLLKLLHLWSPLVAVNAFSSLPSHTGSSRRRSQMSLRRPKLRRPKLGLPDRVATLVHLPLPLQSLLHWLLHLLQLLFLPLLPSRPQPLLRMSLTSQMTRIRCSAS
jgi:hypothetical protein